MLMLLILGLCTFSNLFIPLSLNRRLSLACYCCNWWSEVSHIKVHKSTWKVHFLAVLHTSSQLISMTQISQSGSLTLTCPDEDDSTIWPGFSIKWQDHRRHSDQTVLLNWSRVCLSCCWVFFFFLQFVVVIVSWWSAASGCNCSMCSAMWLDRGRRRMLLSYPPPLHSHFL